jgi:tetratricopeptide (TPR) repeat protein
MATSCLYQGMWKGTKTLETMRDISLDTSVPEQYRIFAFAEASRASEGTSSYKSQKHFVSDIKSLSLDREFRDLIYHLNLAAYHHIQDNPVSWWWAYRNYNCSDSLLSNFLRTSSLNSLVDLAKNFQKNIHHGIASSIEKLNRVKLFKSKLKNAIQIISPYTNNTISCDLDFLCEALFIHGKLFIHKHDISQAERLYVKALEIARWIKKDHSIDQALRGLAKINGIAGNYDAALIYLDESYGIAKNTEEPILKARNYLTRSWLYKRKSENLQAKIYKRKGFAIYQQHRGMVHGFFDANFYLIAGR